MSYFDLRGAHSGKSTTDECYSFCDLFDKLLGNALFAGASFSPRAAELNLRAVNSPVISIGGNGNTFSLIGKGSVLLNSLTQLEAMLPFSAEEHNRVVTYKLVDYDDYLRIIRACDCCTSVNGFVKSALLSQEQVRQRGLFIAAGVSGSYVYGQLDEEDGKLFIVNAFADWKILNHTAKWFAGVPYILSEGVISFPDTYVTPRTIDRPRTAQDAVFTTVRDKIVDQVVSATRHVISPSYGVARITRPVDPAVESWSLVCDAVPKASELSPGASKEFDVTAGQYKRLSEIRDKSIINLISSERKPDHYRSLTATEFVDAIMNEASSESDRDLRRLYDRLLAASGGVSTDPFSVKTSKDTVSYPDTSGRAEMINGSLLDLLFQFPGFFFFDSLASIIFTSTGSALSGGLPASVFRTLYRSTYSHGILNYAKQSKQDDPLTRFDLEAMLSGELVYGEELAGVPGCIEITSRTIEKRNVKVRVAAVDWDGKTVEWSVPREITGGSSDLEFSFEIADDIVNALVRRNSIEKRRNY